MTQIVETPADLRGPRQPGLTRNGIIGLAAASVISGALVLLLLARLVSAAGNVGPTATTPLVGHPAPAFTISVWNGTPGQTLSLDSLKGHPVVLNFWASWCENCADEQYVFSRAYAQYQPQGVVFIGIAFQDKQSDGTAFLQQRKVAYPCGPASAKTPIDYAVTGVPETVFIDRNGIVVGKNPGPVDDATLDQSIQSLLKS